MSENSIAFQEKHQAFLASSRRHVLMITNHGIHQWRVIPGLPDTGGQNVFVNQFTAALADSGLKITIVNRGGYPHPVTGEPRTGLHYKDEHQRILYLEDGLQTFVRKEDMGARVPALTDSLQGFLGTEGTEVHLIVSHYWDGAAIGAQYNNSRQEPVQHIWIPHSLGTIKKRNVPQERWSSLRIDERIATERELVTEVDVLGATSSTIRRALGEDYGCTTPVIFLPPCVDPDRYHPRQVPETDEVWGFLSQRCGLSPEAVRASKIVTEISRTDTTKRKDVLIKAFAIAHRRVPDSLLVVSIDENKGELARDLPDLIHTLGLRDHVAVVGSIWDLLPTLYAITDVYCTPSVMEGFGMSAQEAAATGVPVVASHLVPFATEHLLGNEVTVLSGGPDRETDSHPVRRGQGALVVQADDVHGFAHGLEILLTDENLRQEMGQNAYHITVPAFTWPDRVTAFLDQIGLGLGNTGEHEYEPAD
jgi:glycosyltransferase involved in cell wall biosynthesis